MDGKIKDFFFGELERSGKTLKSSLNKFGQLTGPVNKEYFTSQVERLFEEYKGFTLVLTDGTSHPDFESVLKKIDKDRIGLVKVFQRNDVNTNVDCTLACELYFKYGVIEVRPHWTAYKDIRMQEVFTTLIEPLWTQGLINKTSLVDKLDFTSETYKNLSMSMDKESIATSVIALCSKSWDAYFDEAKVGVLERSFWDATTSEKQ